MLPLAPSPCSSLRINSMCSLADSGLIPIAPLYTKYNFSTSSLALMMSIPGKKLKMTIKKMLITFGNPD